MIARRATTQEPISWLVLGEGSRTSTSYTIWRVEATGWVKINVKCVGFKNALGRNKCTVQFTVTQSPNDWIIQFKPYPTTHLSHKTQ